MPRDTVTIELQGNVSLARFADAVGRFSSLVRMQVSDFHTYDSRLQVHAPAVSLPVREPFTPQGQLPGA